jgi:hypothetical protein
MGHEHVMTQGAIESLLALGGEQVSRDEDRCDGEGRCQTQQRPPECRGRMLQRQLGIDGDVQTAPPPVSEQR